MSDPGPIETSPLRYVEKPVPAPGPGELLVQVLACGVCRTDLHVSEGDLPVHREHVTPGHMVVGRVAALGEGTTDHALGDRVGVAWLRYTDGTCPTAGVATRTSALTRSTPAGTPTAATQST